VDLTSTATDELKLDIAIKATGIDVIDITKDYKVFNVLKYCQLPFLQEQKYLPRIFAVKKYSNIRYPK
jgi:rRNA maturation endonuclease Nob1